MVIYVISKTQLYIRTLINVTAISYDAGIYTVTRNGIDEEYSSNDYYIQISILEDD